MSTLPQRMDALLSEIEHISDLAILEAVKAQLLSAVESVDNLIKQRLSEAALASTDPADRVKVLIYLLIQWCTAK